VTSLTPPTATDNCDGEIVGTADVVFPITQTTTVQWTFEDASGNSSTQNQVVTIDDSTAPIADIQNLPSIEAQCEVTSLTPPTATDNCDGEIIGTTDVVFPITQTTTVQWTFEDASGNSSTQNQVVTIDDSTAPIADIQNLPSIEAQCVVTSLTPPTATDNCDGEIIGTTDAVLPITETETITWTYQDESGNSVTQNQLISINDTQAPIADVENLTSITAECVVTSLNPPTATDNCDGEIIGTADVVFPITQTTTVQWTFEDASGNSSTQNQVVTIDDSTAPIADIQNLPSIEAQCVVTSLTPPTATDNCDGEIIGTADVVLPITQTTTVQWIFEDASGNSSTQNQLVTIDDSTAPVPDLIQLEEVIAACQVDVLPAPTASDNCDVGQIIGTTETAFPITENTTVVWSFEDASGNSTTQTQNIVIDNSELSVTLNDTSITLVMDEDGFANIQSHTLDFDTNDTCNTLSFTYDNEIFDCEDFNSSETNQVEITFTLNGQTIDVFTLDVILTDPNGSCQNISTDSFNKQNISIYPNPANFTVNIVNTIGKPINAYEIYDLKGRKLRTINNRTNINSINVGSYEEGIYILKLHSGSSTVIHKFIIKR
ncbi:T9SS type A sorting domain-containing protein, partial [Psychroflexus salis]|uniref:T9SS type A sorting domain-containing protein n=1 Tax=Psychroflexus salis TaxID=1526574 RepID=UPI001662C848